MFPMTTSETPFRDHLEISPKDRSFLLPSPTIRIFPKVCSTIQQIRLQILEHGIDPHSSEPRERSRDPGEEQKEKARHLQSANRTHGTWCDPGERGEVDEAPKNVKASLLYGEYK